MFDLHSVRIFTTIVRLGSFSAAARAHGTTQPSISRRIKELEQYLGVSLFDTRRKRAILTAKGAEFLIHATDLLRQIDNISTRMTEALEASGTVRVGASETVALTWLSRFIEDMRSAHPRIILTIDVDLVSGLIGKFRSGILDIIIVPPVVREYGTETLPLGTYEYSWMSSPGLTLPPGPMTPAKLAELPIISLSEGSALYQMATRWFREHGAVPNWVNHCSSLQVVTALTEAGLGISLLPLSLMTNKVSDRRLRQLAVEPAFPKLNFTITYHTNATSPALMACVRQLQLSSTFEG